MLCFQVHKYGWVKTLENSRQGAQKIDLGACIRCVRQAQGRLMKMMPRVLLLRKSIGSPSVERRLLSVNRDP